MQEGEMKMRELNADEMLCCAGGGPLNFSSPMTTGTLNNVANATTVVRMLALSFTVGYSIGTYLNDKFNISTRIVDRIL
jgi:hypothetical protein